MAHSSSSSGDGSTGGMARRLHGFKMTGNAAAAPQLIVAATHQDWMPAAGSGSSRNTDAGAGDNDHVSDWLSSITGPTAIISSPTKGQLILLSAGAASTGVLFNGSLSQPLVGTELVSYDWDVIGRTAENKVFQTSFVGATRQVALSPGRYSATLMVQAVQLNSGDVTAGSDNVAAFTVSNGTLKSAVAAAREQGPLTKGSIDSSVNKPAAGNGHSTGGHTASSASMQQSPASAAAAIAPGELGSKLLKSPASAPAAPVQAASPQAAFLEAVPPYLTDGTGNPFGWAFGPVLKQVDQQYGPNSEWAHQQLLRRQEEDKKRQELERARQILFPLPPPPPP